MARGADRPLSGARSSATPTHSFRARIVPEPDNPHDANALMFLDAESGEQLGYIPREHAAILKRESITCTAYLIGGKPEEGKPSLGVVLLDAPAAAEPPATDRQLAYLGMLAGTAEDEGRGKEALAALMKLGLVESGSGTRDPPQIPLTRQEASAAIDVLAVSPRLRFGDSYSRTDSPTATPGR